MIARFDILTKHLGCYAEQSSLPAEVGQEILFICAGEVVAKGIIVAIEPPGSCIRPDMEEFRSWTKIHWQPTLVIGKCPKCKKRLLIYGDNDE